MAGPLKPGAAPAVPAAPRMPGRRPTPGPVRFFRKPEVRLIRMGREVAVFRGAFGAFDVERCTLEFRNAVTTVESAELSARRITMDLPANRLTAEGRVRFEEAGVALVGSALTAVPSLVKLAFRGKARLEADDREAAVALLGAKGL
ncbi:MAG: hypothetical protein AAB152_13810 [Candidatus Coatesbacteria bacterium]